VQRHLRRGARGRAYRCAVQFVVVLLGLSLATSAAARRHHRRPKNSAKQQRAENLALQAAMVAKEGKLGLAAEMFHQAFAINQTAWAYLYSAARAEQLSDQIKAARRDYKRFLDDAPAAHPLRGRATRYAKAVEHAYQRATRRAEVKRQRAATAVRERQAANRALGYRRIAGWITVGLGAATAATGAWLYSSARSRKADLEKKTTTSGGAPIRLISYQEAQNEANDVRSELRIGGAVVGVSAAVLAVGGWMVWSTRGLKANSELTWGASVGDGVHVRALWRF